MSLLLLDGKSATQQARTGLVRANGHCVFDDQGLNSYLGATLFWAPYGIRNERDRILKNMDYYASQGVDYIRILCEVDWKGREIDPTWPDYQEVMGRTIDEAYARGMRSQLTLIGGASADHMDVVNKMIPVVKTRREKVIYIEDVNESSRLDKADRETMVKMTKKLRAELPHIMGLSCLIGDWASWAGTTKAAGGDIWIIHTERNEADAHWRQVRQAYDFSKGAWTGSNQEGPGPQSSVGTMEEPLHLAMFRYLSHIAKCGFFTFHVGAGVVGVAGERGRPANVWESPRIDEQFAALRMVKQFIPEGVQNWKMVNNGRDDHPLPLNEKVSSSHDPVREAGFWEGSASKYGSVNKNYMVTHQDGRFVGVLTGVNAWDGSDTTLVGTARRRMSVKAFNPVSGALVDFKTLGPFEQWRLPGRTDKQIGYIVDGRQL